MDFSDQSGSEPEPAGPSSKRRHHRNRRVNAMEYWQKGVIDDTPIKERWSREFKNPRIKRVKDPAENLPEELQVEGLVVEVHRRTCEVRLPSGEDSFHVVTARYRATVVEALGEFPAVGDRVTVGQADRDGEFMVLRVHPRRTALVRPGPQDRLHQQLIQAANVDQVVIVASVAQPAFNYGFADRFLLAATLSQLPMVLVLNKVDLAPELPEEVRDFLTLVDRCIPVSAHTGAGMEALRALLLDKVSVFSGQSGVGKSTLINQLVPDAGLRTGLVREKDGKGRHTTTSASLFEIPGGGTVIDTPGIRALGLVDLDPEDLARCFPGFFPDGNFTCRFKDCRHQGEPGCSVIEGVQAGRISTARWQSYLRILEKSG
ncbi:MAG TPA: ribosome small subunit-dependent GTPase A [Fibrobacteraceae bacterium]|nr:ribosome small subunit-dependent GTPase A [Fibrobacteraceae bacterium]